MSNEIPRRSDDSEYFAYARVMRESLLDSKYAREAQRIVEGMVRHRLAMAEGAVPNGVTEDERQWFVGLSQDKEWPEPSILHLALWSRYCSEHRAGMTEGDNVHRLHDISRAMETETGIRRLEAEGNDREAAIGLYADNKLGLALAATAILEFEQRLDMDRQLGNEY